MSIGSLYDASPKKGDSIDLGEARAPPSDHKLSDYHVVRIVKADVGIDYRQRSWPEDFDGQGTIRSDRTARGHGYKFRSENKHGNPVYIFSVLHGQREMHGDDGAKEGWSHQVKTSDRHKRLLSTGRDCLDQSDPYDDDFSEDEPDTARKPKTLKRKGGKGDDGAESITKKKETVAYWVDCG